jgi:hypothetical protein
MVGPAVVVAGLSGLAGCGDPDNVYVANERAGVFVRLPPDWTTFEVLGRDPSVRDSPVLDPSGGRWRVVFDSSSEPSRFNLETAEPDSPVGFLDVIPASLVANPADQARNSLPLTDSSVLRSSLFRFAADPLDPELSSLGVDLEVVDYDEIELDGYWGNRLVGQLSTDNGSITVENLTFADDGGERLYQLHIFCSVECFDRHRDEIDAVVDSFTLGG